jgi:transcriptional regulator with XRE-family HTH domain
MADGCGQRNMPTTAESKKQIADKIRARREHMGLSQYELSAQMGKSRPWLQQVENGSINISPELTRLASKLRTSVFYFLDDGSLPAGADEAELIALYRAVPSELKPIALGTMRGFSDASTRGQTGDGSKNEG